MWVLFLVATTSFFLHNFRGDMIVDFKSDFQRGFLDFSGSKTQ